MNSIEKKEIINRLKVQLMEISGESGIKVVFNIPGNVKSWEKIKAELTEQL